MNVMMVCDTPSKDYANTYQISLNYLELQNSYDPDKFRQIYDLWVKKSWSNDAMMVRDIPYNGQAPTYLISLTNIERRRS